MGFTATRPECCRSLRGDAGEVLGAPASTIAALRSLSVTRSDRRQQQRNFTRHDSKVKACLRLSTCVLTKFLLIPTAVHASSSEPASRTGCAKTIY
jgi:hypothetical protein